MGTKDEEEPMEEEAVESKPEEAEEESKPEVEKEAKVEAETELEAETEKEPMEEAESKPEVETKNEEEAEPKPEEETKDEDDSINIMLGDEDLTFDDDGKDKSNLLATLPKTASPPRPETAPVVTPFTSKDTISLASRNNKAPSENSSMRVAIDESES